MYEAKNKKRVLMKIEAPQNLVSLKAQIQTLTSPEFRNSSIHEEKEIDLLDVMKKNQIAYFQLNLNSYGFLGKKIGKILVQDLKVISSQIQSGQVDFKPLLLGVLIDEFGSFATPDFSDFLKQVRSAGTGVHLFCQGLADLNVVSQSFSNQVLGSAATKIILRQDVKRTLEKWAFTAVTRGTVGRSFQVSERILGNLKKQA